MIEFRLWTKEEIKMVIPVRFERTTLSLEGRCSIQLSYGTTLTFRTFQNYQTLTLKLRLFKNLLL